MGWDFDDACYVGGGDAAGVAIIAKLARAIRRSGRSVAWTIGPNKPSVVTKDLPATLPHGRCDRIGLREQDAVLDDVRSPWYVPMRQRLASYPGQTYWRTDGHWTSVATSMYARALAKHLDPRLGPFQHFQPTIDTRYGDLAPGTQESAPGRLSDAASDVITTQGVDPGMGVTFDLSWQTDLPRRKVWPGSTALIGDSFTFVSLPNIRPIFERGRYLWVGHVSYDTISAVVHNSRTVVLEFLQRGLSDTVDLKKLAAAVRRGLRS